MSAEQGWIEADEAGCRLLLHLPAGLAPRIDPERLSQLLALDAVAGLLVETEVEERLAALAATATAAGRACLLVDAAQRVKACGAHGCHLSDWRQVRTTRALLGPGWILGASCGLSRHAAMVAGEEGADYVLFGRPGEAAPDPERLRDLVAWWSELFYLPCAVALGTDPAGMERHLAAGADFLVPTLVADGEGPTSPDGIRDLASRLSRASSRRSSEP